MNVDPRELTAGYAHTRGKGVASYAGVLRDGKAEEWRCTAALRNHRPHVIPTQAAQCARAELERRMQGAQVVIRGLACAPCWLFWDLGAASQEGALPGEDITLLMRGRCPRCTGPGEHVELAVLHRGVR